MSSRPSTTDSSGRESPQGGRFVTLESARYLLLTTFKQDGTPMAVPVRVAVDGDRAYFGVWDASGTAKRLRRTDWVQVSPCTVLGVCRTGPTVDATARLLVDDEASWAAEQLAPKYPVWRRFLGSLADRMTGRQAMYYEVQPDEAPAEQPSAVAAQRGQPTPVRLVPAGSRRRSGR